MTQSTTQSDDRPIPELLDAERIDWGIYARMALATIAHLNATALSLSIRISRFGLFWWLRCLQLWVILKLIEYAHMVVSGYLGEDDNDGQSDDDTVTEWEDRN